MIEMHTDMNQREEIKSRIQHLKEVEVLLIRGKEDGLLREVRRLIHYWEKEWISGIKTGKWNY